MSYRRETEIGVPGLCMHLSIRWVAAAPMAHAQPITTKLTQWIAAFCLLAKWINAVSKQSLLKIQYAHSYQILNKHLSGPVY